MLFSTPSQILRSWHCPVQQWHKQKRLQKWFHFHFGGVFRIFFGENPTSDTTKRSLPCYLPTCAMGECVQGRVGRQGKAGGKKLQQNLHCRLSHHGVLKRRQSEQLIPKAWKHELSRPHQLRNHNLKTSLPEENSTCMCFLEAGWCLMWFLNDMRSHFYLSSDVYGPHMNM